MSAAGGRGPSTAVVAIFGPTAVGKTAVAIELAGLLRANGEDPVAISCDAIQVYRGLEVLSGAPSAEERARLEHRLVGVAGVEEEFSAGRFAELARAEIDSLVEAGRLPIVVGGTGLYMRAALAELDLRPPVPEEVRRRVESEIAELGPAALHAELDPDIGARVHPNDRKRVARALELQRAGLDPPQRSGALWTARLRHPTALIGLVVDREQLAERIDSRVEAMAAAGAAEEARFAHRSGASRTATSAIGFDDFVTGDIGAVKAAHRRYGRRQMTWLRRMEGAVFVDRSDLSDREAAEAALGHILASR